jgi:hypothetical protein
MGFQSRELHIAFTKREIVWTFNINHSPVQGALECGYENSLAHRRLSELSVHKYHTLMSEIGDDAQENKAENQTELLHYCVAHFWFCFT